jgi:NAD(P)-dependent dehydrogenase (short-subunit alcohol dehydrogenase family)
VILFSLATSRSCPGRRRVPVVTAELPPFVAALALGVRARPGEPDRCRLWRLAAVGVDPRRWLEQRRERLRATLPIGRVVEPADVAALAVHLMVNTAVTGATFDIDGGARFGE